MAEVSRLLPGSDCQLISFPVGHGLFARVWFTAPPSTRPSRHASLRAAYSGNDHA